MHLTTFCLTRTTIATTNSLQHSFAYSATPCDNYFRRVWFSFFWHPCLVHLLCIGFAVLCSSNQLSAQFAFQNERNGEDAILSGLTELQAIRFVGCSLTSPDHLIGVIQSRESELSITRRLALYFGENVGRNPAAPKPIVRTLKKVQHDLRDELRYFSSSRVVSDSIALLEYLNQNGFHKATVLWKFFYDRKERKNVLEFVINEGPQATIDTVMLFGLDSLPADIRRNVDNARTVHTGDPFVETNLIADMQRITRMLQNSGYYKAGFSRLRVRSTDSLLSDSVAVVFVPGPRKRIAAVEFEENPNGYPSVSESMRKRQLEFENGEWYSRDKIEHSRSNLMQLGVFELVTIDTIAAVALPDSGDEDDSSLVLRVFSMNNKPYDLGFNFLFFQTAVDNYLNIGVGASYQHRNVFGGAQVGSVTAQYILQDVSRMFQGQPLEREALISGVIAWPSLFRIWNWRGGLNSNAYYSERLLVSPFRLQSLGLGARIPVNLPMQRVVNGFDITFGLERQVPRDFQGALDSALKDAETPEEIAFVYSTFNQFLVLDSYLGSANALWFTGIYLGANVRGEHRDNPIDPRKGHFANISVEAGYGAGKFVRSQVFFTSVFPTSEQSGIATKVKLGHIHLLDFKRGSTIDTNTYVSLERQFFAGGAASIRSYPSRLLHDPHSGVLETSDTRGEQVLANTVGSGSLIELGVEYRYRFRRPTGWDDLWGGIVERSGVTLFTDIGNVFNRMTTEKYGSMRLEDVWLGSVIAVGIGYRFETPVGPFRLDYATSLYDPLRESGKWMFSGRTAPFSPSNWQISIGLGHTF